MSPQERQILRELAQQVRDIAELPEMALRRQRWQKHNQLQSQRPMVLCFPEGAWAEILPQSSLQCTDAQLRGWEYALRSQLYWWQHIHDDNVCDPWFDLNWHLKVGDYGLDVPYTRGENRGSYVWDAPIKDLEHDLDKLRFRSLSVDRPATQRDMERAQAIFGDILPPRIRGSLWWTVGMTWEAAKLVGLENLMLAMYDQPEGLHRLMGFLRDEHLHFITWAQQEGLLTPNDGADYVGSGGVGYVQGLRPEDKDQGIALGQRWGFAESQETVGISPQMFQEFVLPYQIPLLEKFGLNCYGCCEGLEHRLDSVLEKVPRLRRVSVAPNADQKVMAEKLAGRYVFSRKPYPAHVCVGFNEKAIREDLRSTLQVAGKGPLELILKDTHTVQNEAWRLGRWVQIAYEEVERHCGSAVRESGA